MKNLATLIILLSFSLLSACGATPSQRFASSVHIFDAANETAAVMIEHGLLSESEANAVVEASDLTLAILVQWRAALTNPVPAETLEEYELLARRMLRAFHAALGGEPLPPISDGTELPIPGG